MRTTMIIPDELYRQVKEQARAEDRTVTSFVEHALRRELARRDLPRQSAPFRIRPSGGGGQHAGVDFTSNAAILDLLDEGVPPEGRR